MKGSSLCACLLLLFQSVNSDVFSKLFREDFGIADQGSSIISSGRTSSKFDCVSKCLNTDGCLAVIYHNVSQNCAFLNSEDTLTSNADQGYSHISVGEHCSTGWVEFEGSCYLFGDELLSWDKSKEFCVNEGATLVEIETETENTFIQSKLSTIAYPKHWIGLTDLDLEDLWVWPSTGQEAIYKDFEASQPNEGRDANCAAIWQSSGYQWVDEPCSHPFRQICEQSSTSSP